MKKQSMASLLKEHAIPSSSKQRNHNDVITVKPGPIIIGTNEDGEPTRKVEFKVVRRRNLHCQWLMPVTKAVQILKKKQTLDNGEIEPEFYKEFKGELGRIWGLYDQHGFQHAVEFNDDDEIPRVTNGWGFLRDHYKFTGHHQILFKYLGINKFQINQFQIIPTMTPTNASKFPTWHTSSLGLRKAVAFEMKITEDPNVVSYLTLPEEMGEFLAKSGLDEIWIAGTNGEKHKCILRYQFDPFVVRIESGWHECVGINNLHVGDWIVFHIYDIYKDHVVWVRKIGEDWLVEKVRRN